MSAWKTGRLSDIAEQNRLPAISLIESAGADLPNQSKIFVPGGRGFRDLTRRSERADPDDLPGVRQLDRGRRVHPGHERLRRDGREAGAGLPRRPAAREDGDRRGDRPRGARRRRDALADLRRLATTSRDDERDAIRLGREIVAHLDWRKGAAPLPRAVEPPRYDPEELLGIVSPDIKVPFDSREVIARIVDGSRFSRVQAALRLDAGLRLGPPPRLPGRHPREQRHPVLASRANKGAQFIQLCNQSRHAAAVPAEHHRLHGRQEGTSRKASSSTARSSSTRCRTAPCRRSRS